MQYADAAIAGGGIIGLATALELRSAGCKVVVFDRAEAMSEASRAAAGMLAGNDPENPQALRELARLSLALYPDFLARVEELSGAKVPVRTNSTVQGSHQLPPKAIALSAADVQQLAPGAHVDGWHFYLIEEQSIDAWDLAEALPGAALVAGVELREHTSVMSVRAENGGVRLETSAGPMLAGSFLNAAGAWSPKIHGSLPVSPRKGHMLTAELRAKAQMQCVLRTPNVYIVPRGNGRYTIGPTVEDAGFDKEVHPEKIQALFQKAVNLWPALGDANVAETWTGLRPGSEDGLPILDQAARHCWVATGHYKNGIMLGPGTAKVMSQRMTESAPSLDLAAFAMGRFAAAPHPTAEVASTGASSAF
jgi:glycine oxidase